MPSRPDLQAVPAAEFFAQLERYSKQGTPGTLRKNFEVTGPIDVSGMSFAEGLTFEGIRFTGEAIFADCTFGGPVWMHACTFEKGIDLSQSIIQTDISLTSCSITRSDTYAQTPALSIARSRIEGNVSFVDLNLCGRMTGRGVQIRGDLSFVACDAHAASSTDEVLIDFSVASITGSVLFETSDSTLPPQLFKHGEAHQYLKKTIENKLSRFKASPGQVCVNLTNTTIHDVLDLSYAEFGGTVDLTHLKCREVSSDGAVLPGDSSDAVVTATVRGELRFSGAELGFIQLHGIRVDGAILFIAGNSGQINIDDWCAPGGRHVREAAVGAFYMTCWHALDFVRCNVSDINEHGNQSGYMGVEITSSKIEKELTFWPGKTTANVLEFVCNSTNLPFDEKRFRRLEVSRWNRHTRITGKVRIANTIIRGDLDLTGIQVKRDGSAKGRIAITDSEVEGRITFASPVSFLSGPRNESPLLRETAACHVWRAFYCARGQTPLTLKQSWATCDTLDMQAVTTSDIDLTGLRIGWPVTGEGDADLAENYDASLQIVHTAVRRRVDAFCRLDERILGPACEDLKSRFASVQSHRRLILSTLLGKNLQESDIGPSTAEIHTVIRDSFNLQYSNIGELRISDHSFKDYSANERAQNVGLVLDFAKLRRLSVARGSSREKEADWPSHNGFPRPVSLLDIDVDSWFLEPRPEGTASEPNRDREPASAEPYLDMLDNDPEFRMSTYAAVERSLRDRGFDREADQIYIAACFRDARTGKERRPGDSLIDDLRAWSSMSLFPWRPGHGRFRRRGDSQLPLPFFRLARDVRESFAGLALMILWSVALCFTASLLMRTSTDWAGWLLFVALMLIARLFLRIFLDRLHWTLLDYGTSAFRLAVIIFLLMLISFVFVSGERENFEATTAAQTLSAVTSLGSVTSSPGNAQALPSVGSVKHPRECDWGVWERLWMTLRYHVPLVSAVVTDEWQAADSGLRLAPMTLASDKDAPGWWRTVAEHWPAWWPMQLGAWPKARDWFGVMQWINWILWPLFLPFIVRKLSRFR